MAQTSVADMTLLAKTTFINVISEIQGSCLNYSIQLTPYSAIISLRKYFVTDQDGVALLPFTLQDKVAVVGKGKNESDFQELEEMLESVKKIIMIPRIRRDF